MQPRSENFEALVDTAVADTVTQAEGELSDLSRRIHRWQAMLEGADARNHAIPSCHDLVALMRVLDESLDERLSRLATFNVVVFGRTATGKSSLIEALTRGDGRRVSPDGRLDYTRDLYEVQWAGCVVTDTPGIEGWADHDERERIEALAHHAVQRADLVVLMFDDLNQKIREFEQVAEWVAAAGKAAIALLNVRDGSWRFDEKLWDPEDRVGAVDKVAAHAGHVRTMLGEVGLPEVPVIAISAQWALAARSSGLGAHPARQVLLDAVESVGADALERISNLPAVIDLVTESLRADAAGLRLAGIHEEVEADLTRLRVAVADARAEVETDGTEVERQLLGMLAKTGVRPRGEFGDALTTLRTLGGPEIGSREGDIRVRARQILDPLIVRRRNAGAAALRKRIEDAFAEADSLRPEQLMPVGIELERLADELGAAVGAALGELAEDLRRDAEALPVELALELDSLAAGFNAKAGRNAKWQGQAVGLGAAPLALFGPPGIAAAVAIGIAASFRRRGARKQLRAERTRIEREAIMWLDEALANARAAALRAAEEAAAELGATLGLPLARRAAALRHLCHALDAIAHESPRRGAVGPRAQDVVSAALRAVQEHRHPGDLDAAAKTWLGEDWLDQEARPSAAESGGFTRAPLGHDLRLSLPGVHDVEAWLDTVARVLPGADAPGRRRLTEPPVVLLVGDYSSGKTTLLRRLAAELSLDGADVLPVGAAPTTAELHVVSAVGFDLVDTPGLNSERVHDERVAGEAAADAAVIVAVHTIAAGDPRRIAALVVPEDAPHRGLRVVHVLSRIDGLSARPHDHREAFLRLLDTKRVELRERLEAHEIPCLAPLPLPVAADPGGRHSDRPRWTAHDFDNDRGWDGVADLLGVLERHALRGRPAAALDATLTRLAAVADETRHRHTTLQHQAEQTARLQALYADAQREHKRVERHAELSLHTLIDDALLERAHELADADARRLRKIKADPVPWLVTVDLKQGFAHWRLDLTQEFQAIYRRLESELRAQVGEQEFGDVRDAGTSGGFAPELFGQLAKQAGHIPAAAAYLQRFGELAARAAGPAIGVALEAIVQLVEGQAEKRRLAHLLAAREKLRSAGREWVDEVLAEKDDPPGLLDEIRRVRAAIIDEPLAVYQENLAELHEQTSVHAHQLATITELLQKGDDVLGR